MFVLDASVTLAWFFEDEMDAYAAAVREQMRQADVIAPWLWRLEVTNGLVMAERRGRITSEKVDQAIHVLEALPVRLDSRQSVPATLLVIARRYQRTAYDAVYLHLAQQARCALATKDSGLRQACLEADVPILSLVS